MKKSFILMSLMLGALALTSCNNLDSTFDAPKGNFSFKVSTDTRAGIDNNNVVWQANDTIALGAMISGSNDTMAVAKAFAFAGDDTFTGNIDLDENQTYDFFAVYPYVASKNGGAFNMPNKLVYPDEYSNYLNIGSKSLSQSGESMDGLMKFAPMYGTVSGKTPANLSIPMHHLAALLDFAVVNTMEQPVTIKSLQMSTPTGKNICGTFYVAIDGSISPSGNNYVYNTSTVAVSDAKAIAKGETFHVYMPIAPVSLEAASKVDFKITTDAGDCVISKTLSKAVTFEAGTISTQSIEIGKIAAVKPHYTWDLSKASYANASTESINWTSSFATILNERNGSSNTAVNNYIPGTPDNRTSSRFYAKNKLTITPATGYSITYIEFEATTADYTTAFKGSTLTNATVTANGTTITVTPVNGASAIIAAITKTCGFSSITVYYEKSESITTKVLTDISVSGQKTEYTVGDSFSFDGSCTATYDDNSTKTVTPTSVSNPDMSSTGTKTVTVTYTEGSVTKTATYSITVAAASLGNVVELSEAKIKANISNAKRAYGTVVSYTDGPVTWSADCNVDAIGRPWFQLKKDANLGYLKIEATSAIKKVELTITTATNSSGGIADITKHTAFSGTIHLKTEPAGGDNTKNDITSTTTIENNVAIINVEGNNTVIYVKTSAAARIWGAKVTL